MDQEKNKSQEELSEFLSKFKRDEGFKTPHGYFASMQESILDQVLDKAPSPETKQNWFEKFISNFQFLLKPQYALVGAAAIILIALTVGIGTNTTERQSAFDDLSEADLEYYLDSNIDEMNSQDFYAVLTSNDMEADIPISTVMVPSDMAEEYIEELDDNAFFEFQPIQK